MKKGSTPPPPKYADRFLEWYCRSEMLEDLQGALYEYYYERVSSGSVWKARFMFMLDVFMHLRPHTIKGKSKNSKLMIRNHLKLSLRNIWKYKLTSSLNIIGLGTGITCFMLIFLWVNKELKYDQFHTKADRIYRIANTFTSESESFSQAISGPAIGGELHKLFAEVENGTRFFTTSDRVEIGDQVIYEEGIAIVDPSFLDIFSFPMLAGNKATALNEIYSIVLTESMASKYFDDQNPIGETIKFGELTLNITGVMQDPPESSQLQFNALIPIEIIKPMWGIDGLNERWGGGWFHTYLLLTEGTDAALLEKELTDFIMAKLPDWAEQGMYYKYFLQPITEIHLNSNLRYDFSSNSDLVIVQVFIAIAFVILLLACINYVNLATAGAINRSKEMGVRKIIGAPKWQLVWQSLIESMVVVGLSVVIACLLIWSLLPFFIELTGYEKLNLISWSNLAFLVGLMLVLGLLAGTFPAFMIAKVQVLKIIKGNLKSGAQYQGLRKGLVVLQFTATVVLMISMLVIQDQMRFIQKSDLGMNTEGVLHINFRGAPDVAARNAVIKDELMRLPAISDVSFIRNSYPVNGLSNSTVEVETGTGEKVVSSIYTLRVDQNFANTLGLEMAAGRFYSKDFAQDSTASVVVNEACIKNFGWKSAEDALGKRFGEAPNERTVIGVVKDFHFEALYKGIEPVRFVPVRNENYTTLIVKANLSNTFELFTAIEQVWGQVNPNTPLDISTMNNDLANQYVIDYKFKKIFTVFSIVSLIIGCLGLFGLATSASNQRLREISIRKVLGASFIEIMNLINRDFIILIVIAVLVASPIAYFLMLEWLDQFTYHITFSWTYILYAMLGALTITLLTISAKTLKTAFVNPAKILKDE